MKKYAQASSLNKITGLFSCKLKIHSHPNIFMSFFFDWDCVYWKRDKSDKYSVSVSAYKAFDGLYLKEFYI